MENNKVSPAIIKSLLDTDLYKFTMMQAVFHQYPKEKATYKFVCRNKNVNLSPYKKEIEQEIKKLCTLQFTKTETNYLDSLGHFKTDFINYLKTFKLSFKQIQVKVINNCLEIHAEGLWLETILFEVFVLSIVNEVYFRNTQKDVDLNIGREKLNDKVKMIKDFNKECIEKNLPLLKLSDFGTRRRLSSSWQGEVDKILMNKLPDNFVGTSSVYWAMRHGINAIGTMAHEFLQAQQVLASSLEKSQQETFYNWLKEYPTTLGIALSDIYSVDAFLRDWNLELATRYDGARHDSGDPYVWGEKLIAHYIKLGINPLTKRLVFSDGLDVPRAIALHRHFAGRIQVTFGIGTNITNDFNFKALNIVMKMIFLNGKPVCKISDEPGKAICPDPAFLELVKKTFLINDEPIKKAVNYNEFGFYRVKTFAPVIELANPQFNAKKIIELAKSSEQDEASVLLFPELGLTGYSCEDLFFYSDLLNQTIKGIKSILDETKHLKSLLVFGAPYQSFDGRLYNCAFVCFQGKILGVIPKSHLPNYNEFYEKRWFTSGLDVHQHIDDKNLGQSFLFSGNQIFRMNQMVVGVEICEDLWAPIPPSSMLALAGANVILNLSASNELIAKSEYRKELIKQQSARINGAYVYASASVYESSKDVVFGGHLVIAENGSLIAENERFSLEDSSLSADLDIDKILLERRKNTTFDSSVCKSDITIHIVNTNLELKTLKRTYAKNPFVPNDEKLFEKRASEILTIQSMGLVRRLLATKSKSLVLGLSGGLDSTLALLVCLESVKKLKLDKSLIRCYTLPGFGTSAGTKSSAYKLAQSLGVSIEEISINAAVNQHFKDIKHDPTVINNVYENSQARERTQILFDLANKHEGFVVGTGDLSELALGWCTYNGDHMSNYNVNCSIPKTLVKYLVKYYADNYTENGIREILYEILNATISPELTPIAADGNIQSTEDIVGPYELHDFFLFHFMRNGFSPQKIFLLAKKTFDGSYDHSTIKKWIKVFFKRFWSQQFKRTTLPPGPKVGSVSLSPRGDWRMPDEAKFNIEDLDL
jgi:NAD+ synthase (glutamine-hydrolysing)